MCVCIRAHSNIFMYAHLCLRRRLRIFSVPSRPPTNGPRGRALFVVPGLNWVIEIRGAVAGVAHAWPRRDAPLDRARVPLRGVSWPANESEARDNPSVAGSLPRTIHPCHSPCGSTTSRARPPRISPARAISRATVVVSLGITHSVSRPF